MLENLVFLSLRRKFKDIFYFQQKRECDFVIRENGKVTAVIQVCAQLNEENKEREMGGLTDAMKKLKVPQGVILTLNQEDSWENVRIIPTWKWLLER